MKAIQAKITITYEADDRISKLRRNAVSDRISEMLDKQSASTESDWYESIDTQVNIIEAD